MTQRTKDNERVLVVQLARFGDLLQTTPLLRALSSSSERPRVSLLVDSKQAAVARAVEGVEDVFEVNLDDLAGAAGDGRMPLAQRLRRMYQTLSPLSGTLFDRVINLNTSMVAALISALIPAGRHDGPRLASDRNRLVTAPWTRFIVSLMSSRRLIRFNLVDLLASYAGPEVTAGRLSYRLSPEARTAGGRVLGQAGPGLKIGFQVGSRHESRQWPPEHFAELARRLIRERQAHLFLLGVESEKPLGRQMMNHLAQMDPRAAQKVTDLMGRTSIPELGGVLAGLDLLVTADTGTMHLAAALDTPILALFMGPALCHETGPYGRDHIILQAAADCSPCTEGEADCQGYPCRLLITPDLAFWAANQRLDGVGRMEAPGRMKGVRVLRSTFDDFGVVYRPAVREVMDRTEMMSLAFREAGRRFIRPGYRTDETTLAEELAGYGMDVCDEALELKLQRWLACLAAAANDLSWFVPPLEAQTDRDFKPLAAVIGSLSGPGARGTAAGLVVDMLSTVNLALSRRPGSGPRLSAGPDCQELRA